MDREPMIEVSTYSLVPLREVIDGWTDSEKAALARRDPEAIDAAETEAYRQARENLDWEVDCFVPALSTLKEEEG